MRILLTLLLGFWSSSVFSQVNYVLNGDFEQKAYCPRAFDDFKAVDYWRGIDSNGLGNCDPMDYCHTCANGINVQVPLGTFHYQYPHSGQAFMLTNQENFNVNATAFARHYLQGRLSKNLTMGKQYCVSFYVSLGEGSKYAIKHIGAYLDNGSIDTAKACGAPQTQYIPQVVNNSAVLTDSINWVKIEGSFTATGNEYFITIGNYRTWANSTVITLPDNNYNACCPYNSIYLIDDVSVVESDLKADAGPDMHVGYGDSVYIGRPSSDAVWCDWRVMGNTTIIGQGPGIWVKPAVTTSYVVTQTLCGVTKKDTVKVEVWKAGVTSINGKTQGYVLLSNPGNGSIRIRQQEADHRPLQLQVYNSLGASVYTARRSSADGIYTVDPGDIPTGAYYIQIQDASGARYVLRYLKQ